MENVKTIKADSYYKDVVKRFISHKLAMVGLIVIIIELICVKSLLVHRVVG